MGRYRIHQSVRSGVYEYFAQERIVFGRPFVEAVVDEVLRCSAKRVFVIATRSLSRNTRLVQALRAGLGGRFCGLFDECVAHVPRNIAIAAAAAVRTCDADLLITIGGGSAIDTGKMALVCLAEGIETLDGFDPFYVRIRPDGATEVPAIRTPPLRQIVIPSTLSGGEFSHTAGCTDTHRKVKDVYIQRNLVAPVAILDPAVTVHTPDWLWFSTGIRAVDHTVETICSQHAQPFTDATCMYALEMLTRTLRTNHTEPANLAARLDSQMAAWLACSGMMRGLYGASHGLSWHLSAIAGVPHGYCSCVLLPSVLKWNKTVNSDRQACVAALMGRTGGDAAEAVSNLIAELGVPARLRDVGVERAHFPIIAREAMRNVVVRNNPRPILRPEDVLEVLQLAW